MEKMYLKKSCWNLMKLTRGLWLFVGVVMTSCLSTPQQKDQDFSKKDFVGACYSVGHDTTYRESLFSDSLVFSYDDALGMMLRSYEIKNDSLKIFYLSGEEVIRFKISRSWEDSVQIVMDVDALDLGEGTVVPLASLSRVLHRMKPPEDMEGIIGGDTIAVEKYFWELQKRREEFETKLGKKF